MSYRANDRHPHLGRYSYSDRLAKYKAINPAIFDQIEDVEASIKHHTYLSNQTYGVLTFTNKDVDWDSKSVYYNEMIRPLESLLHKLYDAAYCNHRHSIDDGTRDICTCGAVNYGSGWVYLPEVSHASTVTNYAVA